MKRLLLLAGLLTLAAASYAEPITTQSPAAVNQDMPAGSPPYLMIKRVPYGSGTPTVGVTDGYEMATPVTNGLYHVPGYMPYGIEAEAVEPRVIALPCKRATMVGQTVWACDGYTITPNLGRGENILIKPIFQ
jgi:hypothetical protein